MRNTDFFLKKIQKVYVKGEKTKKEHQIKENHQKRHTFNKSKKRGKTEIKE